MTIESTTARGPRIVYVGSASRPAHSVDDLHAVLGARSGDTGRRPPARGRLRGPGARIGRARAPVRGRARLRAGWPAPESLMRTWPWCAVGLVESGYVDATGKHWTTPRNGHAGPVATSCCLKHAWYPYDGGLVVGTRT